jgi:hypothetical protein
MSKLKGLLIILALGLLALSAGRYICSYVAVLGDFLTVADCH